MASPWYRTRWFNLLVVILIPGLGLALMWAFAPWSARTKKIWTGVWIWPFGAWLLWQRFPSPIARTGAIAAGAVWGLVILAALFGSADDPNGDAGPQAPTSTTTGDVGGTETANASAPSDSTEAADSTPSSDTYELAFAVCGADIELLFREYGTTSVAEAAESYAAGFQAGDFRNEARAGCLAALSEDPERTSAAAAAAAIPTAVPAVGTPYNQPSANLSSNPSGRRISVHFIPDSVTVPYGVLVSGGVIDEVSQGFAGLGEGTNWELSGPLSFQVIEARPASLFVEVYGPVSGELVVLGEFVSACEVQTLDEEDWIQIWTRLDTCQVLR